MLVAREDAESILSPYVDRFLTCVIAAIQEYQRMPPEYTAKFATRTRANIISDFMVHNAKEVFEGDKGIECYYHQGQFRLRVEGRVIVRLKKLNERLRSSNIPTLQAQAYILQIPMEIPGTESLTNLVLGYQWNVLQTAVAGVFVACPKGYSNEWTFEIAYPGSHGIFALPNVGLQPGDQPRHVTAKKPVREEKSKEGPDASG